MHKLFLISSGPGNLNLICLKSINVLYISNFILYDSLININIFSYCSNYTKKILIGKKFNQNSIFKKTIYLLFFISSFRYLIVSRLKSGDINFFSRIFNEIFFFKKNKIKFILLPGITSVLSSLNELNLSLTFRFNISSVLFIIYYNNISLLKYNKSFLDKTIVYYMIGNNFNYIIKYIIDKIRKIFLLTLVESSSLIISHIFIFNIFDLLLGVLDNFITIKLPKLLIISNILNNITINNLILDFF